MKNLTKYIIIFSISLILSISFIFLDKDGAKIKSDASIYFTIANNIANGNGFSDEIKPPYLPTMEREPVYPLFLSMIFYFFKGNILTAQLAQALIYALTSIIIFKVVSSLLSDDKLSFLVSLIIAIFPTIANYTAYLITETLFTFLLTLSILVIIKSLQSDNLNFYSGLLLGIATLCRAVLVLFFVFVIISIALNYYKQNKRVFSYRLIKMVSLLILGYSVVVMPWMLRNYILFSKFSITLRGFGSMYARAVKVNLDKEKLKMYTVYCFSEYLANKLYPDYNLTSTGEGYFYQPIIKKNEEFSSLGISSREEADSIYKKDSIALIRRQPLKFISLGIFEIIKLNSFSQILLLNTEELKNSVTNRHLLPVIRGGIKLLGFFIFVMAMAGIVLTYKDWHKWLILFLVIAYFNIMHFFLDAVGRYAVPIIPYYIFFCILGIREVLNIIKKGISTSLPLSISVPS